MIKRKDLHNAIDSFKPMARARYDEAVERLLELAWRYKDLAADFSWEADEELYRQALAICVGLSDGCVEDARKIVAEMIDNSLDYADADVAFETALSENVMRERMDFAGQHMLELLAIWVTLAFKAGYTEAFTKVYISRYSRYPFLSPLWRQSGKAVPRFGSGYSFDIAAQLSRIGGDLINDAVRYAEWVDAMAEGALYYIMHRGSYFDCPECDAMCEVKIPIETPVSRPHPNCQCWPEYFFDDE